MYDRRPWGEIDVQKELKGSIEQELKRAGFLVAVRVVWENPRAYSYTKSKSIVRVIVEMDSNKVQSAETAMAFISAVARGRDGFNRTFKNRTLFYVVATYLNPPLIEKISQLLEGRSWRWTDNVDKLLERPQHSSCSRQIELYEEFKRLICYFHNDRSFVEGLIKEAFIGEEKAQVGSQCVGFIFRDFWGGEFEKIPTPGYRPFLVGLFNSLSELAPKLAVSAESEIRVYYRDSYRIEDGRMVLVKE